MNQKWWKIGMVGVLGVYGLLGVAFWQLPSSEFEIYFLNIGQGDSILIKTPENHQILVDGGPGNKVIEELSEVMPFFDKTIDMVVLTHPHADHVEGLVEVLKRYEVENVLFTGARYPNDSYDEFLKEIKDQNIQSFIAESDLDFVFGDVLMDVIYPFKSVVGEEFENVNNSSVGLRIVYGQDAVLLTGDLELEGEAELVASDLDLSAKIFKAGHHGSRTSSSWPLLERVQPEIVVIQCGVDNSFGHPHPETIRNLHRIGVEEIWRNDEDGRVELKL